MLVLGIGGYMHDYNCCLLDLKSGRMALAEAERLSRRKHHVIRGREGLAAPIEKVCRDLGVKPRHIDVVVHGHTDTFDAKDWVKGLLPKARHVDVDHHLCHAAGAFFSSGYEEALIVSVDGFGDGSSALIASGRGNAIEEIVRIDDANSIGLEYLRATFHLGLGGYGAEGKTQGLAPYGEPTHLDAYLQEIAVGSDGSVSLSDRLRTQSSTLAVEGGYLNTQILTNRFLDDYGVRRIAPEPLTTAHNNLAASVQAMLEDVVLRMCLAGQRRTGHRNLVLSGGVALNSSMNGRLLKSGAFDRIYALPMASDRGIGLGAARYYAHAELGAARNGALETVFCGSEFSDWTARRALRKGGLRAVETNDPTGYAAEALARGEIVGWVQGRSEMGARALGHRSILADPRDGRMKDIINERVKHREWFRPFAPSVLAENAAEYVAFPAGVADLSFMTFTVEATEKGRRENAAAVHVDGTARVQVVEENRNPEFARLIRSFGEITGVPVLLNTSFNDNDEPIVDTPEDAVATFLKADMDVLVVGNRVVVKA